MLVAGLVTLTDQAIKAAVASGFGLGETRTVIPHALYWTYVRNSHGAFGLFGNNPVVLIALSLGVMVIFGYAFRERLRRSVVVQVAVGAIIGGGVSNILDRIQHLYVVDFIDLGWWPVFNLADVFVTVGTVLLLWHASSWSTKRSGNRSVP